MLGLPCILVSQCLLSASWLLLARDFSSSLVDRDELYVFGGHARGSSTPIHLLGEYSAVTSIAFGWYHMLAAVRP